MAALSHTALILEIVVAVVIIGLLAIVVLLNQRKRKAPAGKKPKAEAAPSYYDDVPSAGTAGQPGGFAGASPGAHADPFAGFATASAGAPSVPAHAAAPAPDYGQMATGAVQAPPAPPAAPAAPSVPAGWLPDPSGTPDTLRYWDGLRWTQHVAQRS